jgi:hypothetical protein
MQPEIIKHGEDERTAHPKTSKIVLGTAAEPLRAVVAEADSQLIREPFPTGRTRLWLPVESSGAATDEVQLIVTQGVLRGVNQHVSKTFARELGGFLLGNRYRCPLSGCEYVVIDNFWAARFTAGDATSLVLSVDAWAEFNDQLMTRFRGKLLVGWYHSHPGMSVFLSQDDVEIQQTRFRERWMFALVVEPVGNTGGFFGVRQNRLHPRQPIGFYEYLDHRAAQSAVIWTNYLSDNAAAQETTSSAHGRICEVVSLESGQAPDPVQHRQSRPTRFLGLAAACLVGTTLGLGLVHSPVTQLAAQIWYIGQEPSALVPPSPPAVRKEDADATKEAAAQQPEQRAGVTPQDQDKPAHEPQKRAQETAKPKDDPKSKAAKKNEKQVAEKPKTEVTKPVIKPVVPATPTPTPTATPTPTPTPKPTPKESDGDAGRKAEPKPVEKGQEKGGAPTPTPQPTPANQPKLEEKPKPTR